MTCVSIVLFADFLAVVHTVRMSIRKSRGGDPNSRSSHGSHLNTQVSVIYISTRNSYGLKLPSIRNTTCLGTVATIIVSRQYTTYY